MTIRNAIQTTIVLVAVTMFFPPWTAYAQVKVDSTLPAYTPVVGVGGPLRVVGTGEADPLCERWIARFCRIHAPNIKVELQCTHSTTALANLVTDKAIAAIMFREAAPREIAAFKERTGREPVGLRLAIDMVAIYVHKDNPIAAKGLSLEQIDAVYGVTRKSGAPEGITTWGQLGLTGEWGDKPINIYGRNVASDLCKYFVGAALRGGRFRDSLKQEMRSVSVIRSVAADKHGIGYCGIRFGTNGVAAVPISTGDGDPVSPTPANVPSYPLLRYLMMYIDLEPGKKPTAMREGLLKYILSQDGQKSVVAAGYLPVDAVVAKQELARISLLK